MPVVWNGNGFQKKEKECSIDRKSRSGRGYKEWVRSRGKAISADPSKQQKRKLCHNEENVAEQYGSNKHITTEVEADGSVSHSQRRERVDFVLRRVKSSSDGEKSNTPNHATQTELQQRENNISESRCNDDSSKLQEKIAHSVADECKSTKTKFVEYWVPVRLSKVQTELYCGSLFSNSTFLCSSSKFDRKDPLHEMLVTARMCCDHPYLLDSSIHKSLVQGIPQSEIFDAEIKMSGKLQLLHKILLEINKRGLRVLILYQSLGAPGPISTRDILDDIIHENFGEDSFVRIDGMLSRSKRKEVLNSYNYKQSGKFACLMETRACVPSVNLKSIDTVIFFNSDWDPMNDLRALQKINLSSQFEQVKVFRLYSAYTVEEKLLMLAKQGMAPEGNIVNLKRKTCHGLLIWGAYYLFENLDEFHNYSSSDNRSIFAYEDSFVEDVFLELSALLPNNDESTVCVNNSFILKVQQTEGVYSGNISLLGEVEYPCMDSFSIIEDMVVNEPPYVFWINLLQGRKPRWICFSSQSPRTRKCVQQSDDFLEESVEASKKCRTEARRKRSLGELQDGDKERDSPGEAADLATRQAPMQGSPSSTEPYSQMPTDDQDQMCSPTTVQNYHPQGTTGHLVEDSVGRSESSVGHPTVVMPVQTAHIGSDTNGNRREPIAISQTSVPLTLLNCQPPEASQLTRSAVLQSLQTVCKELQIELREIQKQKTEALKQHEDMKLQTKMQCEKEVAEILKKYDVVLQNAETAFVGEREVLETRYSRVLSNKSLAEAMLQMDSSIYATSSQEEKKLIQERIASLASRSLSSPCPTYPVPVASPGHHPPANQPDSMHRLPTTSSGNLQAGYQIRAPAPHFRHMKHSPLPSPAAILPSQVPEIVYSPVNLQPEASNGLTRQSLEYPSSRLLLLPPMQY